MFRRYGRQLPSPDDALDFIARGGLFTKATDRIMTDRKLKVMEGSLPVLDGLNKRKIRLHKKQTSDDTGLGTENLGYARQPPTPDDAFKFIARGGLFAKASTKSAFSDHEEEVIEGEEGGGGGAEKPGKGYALILL